MYVQWGGLCEARNDEDDKGGDADNHHESISLPVKSDSLQPPGL